MSEVSCKMDGWASPRIDWIGNAKEDARRKFERKYPGVPMESQDLMPTEDGLSRGYWRMGKLPDRVEGNTIYWKC